jgi:hypothetical protein
MAIAMLNAEAAMVEWPQERRNRLANPIRVPQRLADIRAGLLREVQATSAFAALIHALIGAFNEKADPQAKLTELSAGMYRMLLHPILVCVGQEPNVVSY